MTSRVPATSMRSGPLRTILTTCFATCFLLLLHSLPSVRGSWVNKYDNQAEFACPANRFLSNVASIHHNAYEDRIWSFHCRKLPISGTATGCKWSGYVNDFDHPFAFACPGEGFITGVSSYHHNAFEDRRFKFLCCTIRGSLTHNCRFSSYQNELDQPLNYNVPAGKVMIGMASYHTNPTEDRRFQFLTCDMRKKGKGSRRRPDNRHPVSSVFTSRHT